MLKYIQKWENDIQIVDFTKFTDDNGYSDQDRLMIEKLKIGDKLDLSDGISQYHEIERIA